MRKLKLQMQISVDGFVAGPEGQLDWMTWDEDEKLGAFVNHLVDTSDAILMGRKMTPEFVKYWEGVQPGNREHAFAQKMIDTPKIVFSRTIHAMEGRNVRVENGPMVAVVKKLKSDPGKDLLVYGGATFVSSLIENHLIDELNLFVNATAIGAGMRIFDRRQRLTLKGSTAYGNAIVVNTYEPRS